MLVQCTVTGGRGSFGDTSRRMLLSKKLPGADQRVTFKATPTHNFHLLVENGVRYLCLSTTAGTSREAFVILEAARNKFLAEFGLVAASATAKDAQQMQRRFRPVLQELLEDAADKEGAGGDKYRKVREGIDKVKDEAKRGIELALRNTEHLDALEDKTEQLSLRASEFSRASSRVSRHMWWASKKLQLLFAGVTIVLLLLVWLWFSS